MRRIMVLASAVAVVFTGQVSRSSADPVNATAGPWRQRPPGCTDHQANDVAGSGFYQTCHADSGFTFELAADVTKNAFCLSGGCLEVVRLLEINKALQCTAVTGLKSVKLETYEGREACFGPAGNDHSIHVIERPPQSGSASTSSDTTVSDTAKPAATQASAVVVTAAPGSEAGSQTSSGNSTTMIVMVSSIGTILVVLLAALVFVKFRQKRKRLTVSKHESPSSEYDIRQSTVPIIQEIFSPRSSNYDGGTMLSTPWKSGPSGFGSAFAGWDEELLAAAWVRACGWLLK